MGRTGFVWLRVGSSGGILWALWWTFGFHKKAGYFLTRWVTTFQISTPWSEWVSKVSKSVELSWFLSCQSSGEETEETEFYVYECVSKSFRTESITKCTLATINTRWEATQRVMVANLTRLTHKVATQLHLVAESYTICSSCSRRPVRKLLDTPSYMITWWQWWWSLNGMKIGRLSTRE
jgi:hypothetical protein